MVCVVVVLLPYFKSPGATGDSELRGFCGPSRFARPQSAFVLFAWWYEAASVKTHTKMWRGAPRQASSCRRSGPFCRPALVIAINNGFHASFLCATIGLETSPHQTMLRQAESAPKTSTRAAISRRIPKSQSNSAGKIIDKAEIQGQSRTMRKALAEFVESPRFQPQLTARRF